MGPYCRFCDRRCFVERRLPDDARGRFAGKPIIMATCPAGMEFDRAQTGYDHTTAINPRAGAR